MKHSPPRRLGFDASPATPSFIHSTSLQKALDAVTRMSGETDLTVTLPRIPSIDMVISGATAAGISTIEAQLAYEAMIDAA